MKCNFIDDGQERQDCQDDYMWQISSQNDHEVTLERDSTFYTVPRKLLDRTRFGAEDFCHQIEPFFKRFEILIDKCPVHYEIICGVDEVYFLYRYTSDGIAIKGVTIPMHNFFKGYNEINNLYVGEEITTFDYLGIKVSIETRILLGNYVSYISYIMDAITKYNRDKVESIIIQRENRETIRHTWFAKSRVLKECYLPVAEIFGDDIPF